MTPSNDVLEALTQLSAGSRDWSHFESISRWRLSCGDAEGASVWHFWSFEPPTSEEIGLALAGFWRSLGESAKATELLPESASWEGLAILLAQARYDEAENLQRSLLRKPPTLEISNLLELVADWQRAERSIPALELLSKLVAYQQSRGERVVPQVAYALADLLEKLDRHDEAAQWWTKSLEVDPNQCWPLMRLAYYEFSRQRPAVAAHYCREVRKLNPKHKTAPKLQRKALKAMGARGSRAILRNQDLPDPWQRRQRQWRLQLVSQLDQVTSLPEGIYWRRSVVLPPQESWQNHQQVAIWGDADGLTLVEWATTHCNHPPETFVILWLLASPDPELQLNNLRLLLADASEHVCVIPWPVWAQDRHGDIESLLIAHRAPPPPIAPGHDLEIWQEHAGPHRWARVARD